MWLLLNLAWVAPGACLHGGGMGRQVLGTRYKKLNSGRVGCMGVVPGGTWAPGKPASCTSYHLSTCHVALPCLALSNRCVSCLYDRQYVCLTVSDDGAADWRVSTQTALFSGCAAYQNPPTQGKVTLSPNMPQRHVYYAISLGEEQSLGDNTCSITITDWSSCM
jgi:hypothetical protein